MNSTMLIFLVLIVCIFVLLFIVVFNHRETPTSLDDAEKRYVNARALQLAARVAELKRDLDQVTQSNALSNEAVFQNQLKSQLNQLETMYEKTCIQQQHLTQLEAGISDSQQQVPVSHTKLNNKRIVKLSHIWRFGIACVMVLMVAVFYYQIQPRQSIHAFWQSQHQYDAVARGMLTGTIQALPPSFFDVSTDDNQSTEQLSTRLTQLVTVMQTQAYAEPEYVAAWLRLSRMYNALQLPEQAISALQHAHQVSPDDSQLAMQYIHRVYLANERQFSPSIERMLLNVLDKHPNHEGALIMMIMGTLQLKKYQASQQWLDQLRKVLHQKVYTSPEQKTTALKHVASLQQMLQNAK